MKTLVYKQAIIATAFLLCAFTLSAQEVSKEYSKEYKVQRGNALILNNKYGNINISASTDNAVRIDVIVSLSYPNQERAEKLINYINVDFSESDGTYSVKTNIDKDFNFSGWGASSKKFSIKYDVKMPEWLDVTIINKYGNIETGVLSGMVNIDVKYGDLNALGFTRGNNRPINTVSVSYGKANINDAGWLDFTARYANDIHITNTQALAINSRYSKIYISKASSVVVDSKYDKYSIESIRNIIIDGAYTDYKISEVSKKIELDCEYGSFVVETVPAGFESIDVSAKYCNISTSIAEDAAYNLNVAVKYGKIEYDDDNFTRQKQIIQNNSTELEGVVNPHKSSVYGDVNIDSSYGLVKLN